MCGTQIAFTVGNKKISKKTLDTTLLYHKSQGHLISLWVDQTLSLVSWCCWLWVQVPFRPEFFLALFSLLLKQCTLLRGSFSFTSLSAVQIYDFHIFLAVYSSLLWFIWNRHNNQLPVGFLAQLVERCTGIAEVMGFNPVQARVFFRPYFHYCSSSTLYCEDHFHSRPSFCCHSTNCLNLSDDPLKLHPMSQETFPLMDPALPDWFHAAFM